MNGKDSPRIGKQPTLPLKTNMKELKLLQSYDVIQDLIMLAIQEKYPTGPVCNIPVVIKRMPSTFLA